MTEPETVLTWAGGSAVVEDFTIVLTNPDSPDYGDTIHPAELISPEPITVKGTVRYDGKAAFLAAMRADFIASLDVVRYGPRAEGRRCLWGKRRGYIQVGSDYDLHGPHVTIHLPAVRFDGLA